MRSYLSTFIIVLIPFHSLAKNFGASQTVVSLSSILPLFFSIFAVKSISFSEEIISLILFKSVG